MACNQLGVATAAAAQRRNTKTEPLVARLETVVRQNIPTGHKPLKIQIKPARAVAAGYFSSVAVDGAPIKVKLLDISQFWLRAENIRLDLPSLQQGRVKVLSGQVSARLTITEANITDLLARQQETAGMNFKARILKDAVQISGNATSGLVPGAVKLVGVLTPQQGGLVTFKLNTLTVNGSPVLPLVKMIAQGQVNSALRVDNIPFTPAFKTVRYEKDRVVVST